MFTSRISRTRGVLRTVRISNILKAGARRIVSASILVLALFVILSSFGCADARRPFSIVALPDTQYYSAGFPQIFISQTQWIVEHKKDLNIACVVHEGDITDSNGEPQWQNANKAMSLLDGVVPFIAVPGNHDTGVGPAPGARNMTLYDKYLPASRFDKQPWYGGHMGSGNENSYILIEAEGLKFLVVGIEFGPRDETLAWAGKVIDAHPDRRVILLTHCYMNFDDKRVGKGAAYNPHDYPWGGNDGEEIWEKLVSRHKNIDLVLSGHILGRGTGRLTSNGRDGHPVHQILANYQMRPQGGEGYLRILKFVPQENKIYVSTYSPWLKKNLDDAQNQFVLDYAMPR